MHILISNDDGIFAAGLRCLARTVQAAGHRVTVVAPDGQRSAVSHAISLKKPLRMQKVEYDDGIDAYAVDGTPADCVRLGVYFLRNDRPDLVLSGINNGSNRGCAILYSGTLGAAMEGALNGITSMAVSLCSFEDDKYETAARLAADSLEWLAKNPLPRGEIYNLNVPYNTRVLGVKPAVVSNDYMYASAFTLNADGSYQLVLDNEAPPETYADSDLLVNEAGYASLSVITWNMLSSTSVPSLDRFAPHLEEYDVCAD